MEELLSRAANQVPSYSDTTLLELPFCPLGTPMLLCLGLLSGCRLTQHPKLLSIVLQLTLYATAHVVI